MKKLLIIALALMLSLSAFALMGCDEDVAETPTTNVDIEAPEPVETAETTFVDGVFTSPDVRIEITDHRIIPVGDEGNQFGEEPVLAIWYEVTNLSEDDIDATTAWIFNFNAYQDNDPNMVNQLSVGMAPDSDLLDSQTATIKQDGTVANAIAYILSDDETSVVLVAEDILGNTFGEMVFNIQ